jgi:hypothetical protein
MKVRQLVNLKISDGSVKPAGAIFDLDSEAGVPDFVVENYEDRRMFEEIKTMPAPVKPSATKSAPAGGKSEPKLLKTRKEK